MNFLRKNFIKYGMHKKKIVVFAAIIAVLLIVVPIMATLRAKKVRADGILEMQCVSIWQIDGFEGGRGSRSQYLKKAGERCFKGEKTYVNVVSLTADAARINLERGEIPDIISYPAGFYGIEKFVSGSEPFKTWCHGAYCFISAQEGADFSDITQENTVINGGKDNLSCVAAALSGIGGARYEEPTNAYLQIINGKAKYLLGTQRDLFRFKTRNVSITVKPVTVFNDLYQNVSILTSNAQKYSVCSRYINYLTGLKDVESLGLFGNSGCEESAEGLSPLRGVKYDYILNFPCGKAFGDELSSAAKNGDVNKIKTMLK